LKYWNKMKVDPIRLPLKFRGWVNINKFSENIFDKIHGLGYIILKTLLI